MSYSNGLLSDQSYQTANKYVQRGLPGVGFKLTDTGDYDMQNKKLVNVKNGVNGSDAVTKSQLDTKTSLLDGARTNGYIVNNKAVVYSQTGAVHAKSFYLQDQNEDEVRILTDNQDFDNVHLFVPNLKNFDGFGGRKRSEIMVTSVDQIISGNKFFQNIKAPNPSEDGNVANKNYVDFEITKQNVLIDNEFVKKSGSLMTGDLILPHYNYPVQGNTNKAISYETQREIFISRKETFPMETSLDMNNNVIENIATPTSSHQATNKDYCDYNFLNRQKGGVIMGPLSMNRNELIGLPDTPKFGYSAVNKNYVDGEITKVNQNIDLAPFIKKDGSRAMTGNLNMSEHKIVSLQDPIDDKDAINKKYFEEQLIKSHLLPSHHENAFKYLIDADESSSERRINVNGIVNFNGSPHKNKKAYDVDMIYIAGTQNYDSQIGINIYPLPPGKYTIIMEYFYPENLNIAVSCRASSANLNKLISKNFTGYIKLLVQFEDQTKQTPDYLFFDIRGSGTTSTNPEGYLIFYGIKEWYDNVFLEIYDHALELSMFEYDNGNMKTNTVLDMNNKKIINQSDAINKGQFDTLKNKFDSHQFYIKNHLYMSIFSYRFYDLKEPIKFNYTLPTISGIVPGLSFLYSGLGHLTINELDPLSGLQFNRSIRIIIDLGYTINQVTPYTLMLSLTLKDQMQIYFTDAVSSTSVHYPLYGIEKLNPRITIATSSGVVKHKPYSSQFNDKQVMLWIHFNPASNRYRINLANHAVADFIGTPPSTFATNKLRIDPGNNLINKICYQNQYISADLHYTQILFEEKKNGSHFI